MKVGYTRLWALISVAMLLISAAWAANVDKRVGGTTILPGHDGRGVILWSNTIDFNVTANELDAADTMQLFNIPADTLVLGVVVEVKTVEGATCTIDIGDADDADGYFDGINLNTASNIDCSIRPATQSQMILAPFSAIAVTTATTAVVDMFLDPDDSELIQESIVMPFNGSVVGIAAITDNNFTAGTLTFDATIGTTVDTMVETGLQVALTSPTLTAANSQAIGLDEFTAGQIVGCSYQATADLAPITNDVTASVVVQMEGGAEPFSGGKYYTAAGVIKATAVNDVDDAKVKFSVIAVKYK